VIVPGRIKIGQILHYVGKPLVYLLAWDVAVTVAYMVIPHIGDFPTLPVSLLGSAVAVYLTFRNTTAYARWWEARTLWGAMVNHSRSYARQLAMLMPDDTLALRTQLVHRQAAYVHAVRMHLRRQSPWEELAGRLPGDEVVTLRGVANVPNAILSGSGRLLAREGALDSIRLTAIERSMVEMSNAQGGMERIKNTPFPKQYATYPVFFTHAFCVLLPLGLVDSLGWYTPLGSTAAGFLFLALLQIGNDIQGPFDNDENDVPMTTLTRAIEIDLRDGLGEKHGLQPVQVVDDILW
jgi:putative membrane protein